LNDLHYNIQNAHDRGKTPKDGDSIWPKGQGNRLSNDGQDFLRKEVESPIFHGAKLDKRALFDRYLMMQDSILKRNKGTKFPGTVDLGFSIGFIYGFSGEFLFSADGSYYYGGFGPTLGGTLVNLGWSPQTPAPCQWNAAFTVGYADGIGGYIQGGSGSEPGSGYGEAGLLFGVGGFEPDLGTKLMNNLAVGPTGYYPKPIPGMAPPCDK
jgi:hypothetical protein